MQARRSVIVTTCLVLLAALGAAVADAQRPRYVLHRLEPLETPVGVLDQVRALDLNDRGQIVGRAHNGGFGGTFHSAAFLFTPGVGMKDLDPDGAYLSRALAVNDRGLVFGVVSGPFGPAGRVSQKDVFLYEPGEGFTFLGTNPRLRRQFSFSDLNNRGEVVGTLVARRRDRNLPYLYTPDQGWIDLRFAHPRLAQIESSQPHLLDDRGDVVLFTADALGDDEFLRQVYVLHPDGALDEIEGRFGVHTRPVHRSPLNRTGGLLDNLRTWSGFRTRLYLPGKGWRFLLPRDVGPDVSSWIGSTGLIGGLLHGGQYWDSVFTYDERREPKLRIEITPEDSRAFVGAETFGVIVWDMNDRGDFIGEVRALRSAWFVYSRETGLQDLQAIVDESGGGDLTLLAARRINKRGQILLHTKQVGAGVGLPFQFNVSNRQRTYVVLLSPEASGDDGL